MAREDIFLGTTPGDDTGNTLRAGGQKINNNFIELYNTMVGVIGKSIIPTDTPSGTGVTSWVAITPGTYTNFGGVVVDANSFAVISRDIGGAFTISQTTLDLSTYQKIVDGNKIKNWVAQPYLIEDQVNHLGKDWVANAATISTDVPGTSTKWVNRLSGMANGIVASGNVDAVKGGDIFDAFKSLTTKQGYLQSSKISSIDFDFISNRVVLSDGCYILLPNSATYPFIDSVSIDFTNIANYLIYNVVSNLLEVHPITEVNSASIINDSDVVIVGTFFKSEGSVNLNGSYFTVNGKELNIGIKKTGYLQTSKDTNIINFDFVNSKIIIPNDTYILLPDSGTYSFISAITLSIGTVAAYLFYDISTNTIFTSTVVDVNLPTYLDDKDNIILGTYFPTEKNVNLNGSYFQINGFDYGIDTTPFTFVDTVQRLILPPEMYFIDNEELPLYKKSILMEDDIYKINELQTVVKSNINSANRYNGFNYNTTLKPENLGSIFNIGISQSKNADYNYYANIIKNTMPASNLIGKAIKVLSIGDSLTADGIPKKLNDALTSAGATVTSIGSFADVFGTYGEGKGGWCFRMAVGKSNLRSGVAIPITMPLNSSLSGSGDNPFLKLADASDKTNHPTWCFRNTGALLELSYQDDTDKTGDFYIYDFGWYITNRGITVPDIVTIGYSTNDIGLDGLSQSAWLEWARLGMEIMISQIKTAYPTMIIGVVPNPFWSSSVSGSKRTIIDGSVWIENCMTDIITYQATYTDIHIIPVWCHLNRDWNWQYLTGGYANTVTDISATNQTKKITRGEFIHLNSDGYEEYINVMKAWFCNII